jgi:ribosome-binding ATPase YchF (GTP1/OBG family)
MTSLPEDRPLVISEDDRESAVHRLQEAYVQGHISHEEMNEHLHQVLTAKTSSELASALASLPAESPGTTSTIAAVSGRIQRRGAWRIPRTLKVESAFGRVHLDLSRAIIEHPVVDIELQLGTGRAKITVPRDAIVDFDDVRSGWKAPVYKTPRRSGPGGPRIRISGAMGFGRLKIRHARR